MSYVEYSYISCGAVELVDLESHIDDPLAVLVENFDRDIEINEEECGAFVVYSDSLNNGNGRNFTDYIRRFKLGSVLESNVRHNPNSGNEIQVWIWEPNWEALEMHFERHG